MNLIGSDSIFGFNNISCLGFLMIVLLVPYVKHYYLLENGVQKMYRQYDALLEQIERRKEEG